MRALTLRRFGFAVGLLAVLFVFVVRDFLPWVTTRQLQKLVRHACDTCLLEVGEVSISLLSPGEVTLTRVFFRGGETDATEVEAQIEKVFLEISLLGLASGVTSLRKVRILRPRLVLRDGESIDARVSRLPRPEHHFHIADAQVEDGAFSYHRKFRGRLSVLRLKKIFAQFGAFSSLPALRDTPLRISARGQLENSGAVTLNFVSPLFAEQLQADIDVDIKEQNMSDVNPFFSVHEGIQLSGYLLSGKSRIKLRERKLQVWAQAFYQDFSAKFEKNLEDQGPAVDFFSRLDHSLSQRLRQRMTEVREDFNTVQLQQAQEESLASFVLRGLKQAVLQVTH